MIRRNFKPEAALIAFAATFAVVSADPSMALTAKECSVKYKAAKAAGTLNGLGWNDFRKKECEGAGETTNQKAATTDAKSIPSNAKAAAVFPKSVDSKYVKETAGKARFHTCLDQYRANKASNGNGGMRWIEKGGGYYSRCNTALKS